MDLAKKLIELRKANGYSQEDLAEKLLVSRQAISKWERGDALPDTENLIALSKLYGVSLDEMVGNQVKVKVVSPIAECEDDDDDEEQFDDGESPVLTAFNKFPYPVLTLIAFLLLGFLCNAWWIAWLVFLTVPVYYSVISAIRKRKFTHFDYNTVAITAYLFIGLWFGGWHPWWVICLTVPLYYAVASVIDKLINAKKNGEKRK